MASMRSIDRKNGNDFTKRQIYHAFKVFQKIMSIAERNINRHNYQAAAVCAQIAAYHAFVNHCGIFISPRLEKILSNLGLKSLDFQRVQNLVKNFRSPPEHILHVLTYARAIGGDTRFVWRWIGADAKRCHSVVVTRQGGNTVPDMLTKAVSRSGGVMHIFDKKRDTLSRSQELAEIAACADLVILHLFPDDIVPAIAFADRTFSPPVVYVNLSDHTFWAGLRASNVIAHLRESGLMLSVKRRNIEAKRSVMVPTPIECKKRRLPINEAKRHLGFSEETFILLTIATSFKYEPINGVNFVEAVLPVLEKHRNAVLVAIGPENSPQWREGNLQTKGRVLALGTRSDTQRYYEAADLYIDSFPFSSITSLLEAGSYGTPLVRFCAHHQPIDILGAGAPGIDSTLMDFTILEEYRDAISRLIKDAEYRRRIGEDTRRNISRHHTGDGWERYIENLYEKVGVFRDERVKIKGHESPHNDETDNLLNVLLSRLSVGLSPIIDSYTESLAYTSRLPMLLRLLAIDKGFSMSLFLPPCLERRLSGRLNWVRRVPLLSSWLR
jgi:glycosyltransferase involved in cell wall biosynthesis